MTREEQILEYANSFKGKGMESEELKEIIRLAIIDGAKWADRHPVQPSIPSNLDEAAREYINDTQFVNDEHEIAIKEFAFKAGAEWMAGQGVSIDGKVIMDFSNPDDIINRRLIAKVGDALLEIEPGDVVVQIRKK